MTELRASRGFALSLAVRMIAVHRDIIKHQQEIGKRCKELAVKAAERGDYSEASVLMKRFREIVVTINRHNLSIEELSKLR